MELRVFGGAVLRVGRDAGGRSDFGAQPGTRTADAGGRVGAPERESLLRIAAAAEGSSRSFGTPRSAARKDSIWCGIGQQEGIGYSVAECAETSGPFRHTGLRRGIHEKQARPGSVPACGGESWRGSGGLLSV